MISLWIDLINQIGNIQNPASLQMSPGFKKPYHPPEPQFILSISLNFLPMRKWCRTVDLIHLLSFFYGSKVDQLIPFPNLFFSPFSLPPLICYVNSARTANSHALWSQVPWDACAWALMSQTQLLEDVLIFTFPIFLEKPQCDSPSTDKRPPKENVHRNLTFHKC